MKSPVKPRTVEAVLLAQIKSLKEQKRTGYAMSHLETYNSLVKFNGHINIYFSDMDITWLKRYETWLRKAGRSENTIGIRFRNIRVLYNLAIEQGSVKPEYYPFKKYKVSKLQQATSKRALSKEDVKKVLEYNHEGEGYYVGCSDMQIL